MNGRGDRGGRSGKKPGRTGPDARSATAAGASGGRGADGRTPVTADGVPPEDLMPGRPGADTWLDPRRAAAWLRTLGHDLRNLSYDPMPPSLWLRWLPHGLVVLLAVVLVATDVQQFADGYRLGVEFAVIAALVQGGAVVLAPWYPAAACWLSLTTVVVTALDAREQLLSVPMVEGAPWPWSPSTMSAHAVVLFLLALRVRPAVAVTAVGTTALVTWLVQGVLGAAGHNPNGALAVALFAAVTLVGAALRGRRVARVKLVEQTGITAEERARRTLLEERSRIARELHDVVAHHMSVISIQAQVAPHLVENPPDELKENLDGIRQNALEALTELRRVLGVLRSEHPGDAEGLATGSAPHAPQPTLDRLDDLIDNTRAAGLTIVTDIRGERSRPYPPGVELSAYRIIQEALSNALRHAPGSSVRVEISHFGNGLYLGVINSRPSGPVQPSPGAGHGLLGMRERATMLGGYLHAIRTLHGGFSVSAFLPRDGTAEHPTDPPPGPARTGSTKDPKDKNR
ncbi:sensor histidine kinase [Streptomyces sp. NPDC048290]|uniref:sensor histidine kinase n=1 Tax=Streptomyces sp. NPDC048290 TaxID=3155811 RepID=UPI0034392AC2